MSVAPVVFFGKGVNSERCSFSFFGKGVGTSARHG